MDQSHSHTHTHIHHHPALIQQNWHGLFWISGIGATLWLLLRSGFNPKRLSYPCQQAALAASLSFWTTIVSLVGATALLQRMRTRPIFFRPMLIFVTLSAGLLLSASVQTPTTVQTNLILPVWTNPGAVSNVYVSANVPAPVCDLNGGKLPSSGPCSTPAYAFKDEGVEALINQMESNGQYFYKTTTHPDGLMGADHVVIIKINNQWGGDGDGNGKGRLSTNTDVLKGVIWRVLQHPDGFSGEIVVVENTEGVKYNNFSISPANAQDQGQSYQDVVSAFQSKGYAVSLKDWTAFFDTPMPVHGGNLGDSEYPVGEFARGDPSDRYILLNDPAAGGTDQISYPKFTTNGGKWVSMKYGLWNGSTYEDRLDFINMPVLKRHGMAGATISWKNYVGFGTTANADSRFGGWDDMHDFFWGYNGGANKDYGLIAHEMHDVILPKLNIVDAIWVATDSNTGGNAVRQNEILASTDPFAVDWYASEYILRPTIDGSPAEVSAALDGTFRSATMTNQKAAKALWGDDYHFINLDQTCDASSAACESEKAQLNVLVSNLGGLSIPVLIAPHDTIYTRTPTEQWNTVGGASKYNLVVVRESTGQTIINKTLRASSCKYGLCSTKSSIHLPAGNYHFTVTAYTAAGWGEASTAMAYNVSVPLAPVLIAPEGDITSNKPVYQWYPSTSASKYAVAVINTASGKTIFVKNVSASACKSGICYFMTSKRLPVGENRFKVRALNPVGWSIYSSEMDFSVSLPAP